ncbi:glycoside hydrolase family 65 protein [Thalassomonas viridans]|uniref:Glycoside hydrolase family 65 protein n=1 Tax=Thalassomonas viridans TaxID=137584 RepID=A0AAF0C9G3_9GAMM|nr:glycosyl hydrolase family 65 protein [Thalassomonas viridans]WDE05205.1 glycoside hydrolase family 65 protein [Thalassomonas viridans]
MQTFHHLDAAADSSEWTVTRAELEHLPLAVSETLFALGNGTIGTRGTSGYRHADFPVDCEGTYVNGAYVSEQIHYDESAYGFARFNNKMLQVADSKGISLFNERDDQAFGVKQVLARRLNMKTGVFEESLLLATPSGEEIKLHTQRFVCQHNANLMVNAFTLEPMAFRGPVVLVSGIANNLAKGKGSDDPRVGDLSVAENLSLIAGDSGEHISYQLQQLDLPSSLICHAISHSFADGAEFIGGEPADASGLTCRYRLELGEDKLSFCKYSFISHVFVEDDSRDKNTAEQGTAQILLAKTELEQAMTLGYAGHYQQHSRLIGEFWYNSDIEISGNSEHQKAIRLNMLHLYMSAGRDGQRNIGAKGLTGPGYDGHYFWDSEIYIIPYFIYTQPEIARSLLSFRFRSLDKARKRALEMGHPHGALFPWRTIGGEECSSYFPAGTAQYHINAAVAYAVRHYFTATSDWDFIWNEGAELVFESARLWPSLGHFNEARGRQFCLDLVTGPDEYTALVNNNYYTNVMAKIHLAFACDLARQMGQQAPENYQRLLEKLRMDEAELAQWQKIADNMYLPHDDKLDISPQDDSFLAKKPWDFAGTPKDKYPLLLNFHPLVIYRHQVLKQADVILANFLQDDMVPLSLKKNNLAFYEPLTTHDSTLSACTHSIAYSEVGQREQAFRYFEDTVMTDLANLHKNSHYGVHTAAMAGSWMCVTQGFAGLRVRDGKACFNPFLPKDWQGVSFKLRLLGCQLQITMSGEKVSYQLLTGKSLCLQHGQQEVVLTQDKPAQDFSLIAEH